MDTDESSRQRDRVALEARRKRAIALIAKGMTQSAVARKLGVCRQAVSQWVAAHEHGGKQALASKGKPGRKGITAEQRQTIQKALLSDTKVEKGYFGQDCFSPWGMPWARSIIATVIGTPVSNTRTWEILTELGWKYQPMSYANRSRFNRQDRNLYCSWVHPDAPEGV